MYTTKGDEGISKNEKGQKSIKVWWIWFWWWYVIGYMVDVYIFLIFVCSITLAIIVGLFFYCFVVSAPL